MPELPEVETVVRRLRPLITGRKIIDFKLTWPRIVDRPSAKDFQKNLIGQKFKSIDRRGKYLVFKLESNAYLIGHLRMSGDFHVMPTQTLVNKHVHARFILEDGFDLRFDDTRKFGRLYYVNDAEEVVGKLGIEPLSSEFSADWMIENLKDKVGYIKPLLLNQSFIAGIGNIYAVESLWRAAIHPLTKANKIKKEKVIKLNKAIKNILTKAIDSQGTDIGDGVWKEGNFVTDCYGREDQKCKRCSSIIKRIVVAQRGTEFCPQCQSK